MTNLNVRIYEQAPDGVWHDREQDYDLDDFAGVLPAIGDMILEPGVPQGLDRYDPSNRKLFTVVQRIFNPRDLPNYVALVVSVATPDKQQASLVP